MKVIRYSALALFLSIFFGFFGLVFSYLIPARTMLDECAESVPVFSEETTYPRETYSERQLDNWTDCIMLQEAAYPGEEDVFDKAVNARYERVRGLNPCESFVEIHSGSPEEVYAFEYARYWHGYLLFLRPLLAKLNYAQIRTVNQCIQFALLLAVLYLLAGRCRRCLAPFLVMVLFLAPTAIGNSLQFSGVYYIALLASLYLLADPRGGLDRGNVWRLFLLSGIATAYFDYLTAPTLSLTIPLCLLCARLSGTGTWKENLRLLLRCALLWLVGYAGMWAGKWLISLIFDGRAFLDGLLYQIRLRSSSTDFTKEKISRLSVLGENWRQLFIDGYLVYLTAACAVLAVILTLRRRRELSGRSAADALLFLIPFLIPSLWILFLSNHASVHYWFTYRTLAPCVFSLLCALSPADPPSDIQQRF